MNRAGYYIEDKLEEFRIAGGKPAWIGLTLEVLTKLSNELRAKMRAGESDPNAKITKFLGMDVILIEDQSAPSDGVYFHDERSK